jgi:GAF domain-containing protein
VAGNDWRASLHDTADPAVEPYLALLDVAKAIASHHHLSDVFQDLTVRLHRLLDFHYLSVVLHDAAHGVMRLHQLERSERGTLQPGAAFAVDDIPAVAVDHALHAQAAQALQPQLAREHERLHRLLEVTNSIVAHLDLRPLFQAIAATLRRVMPGDSVGVALADGASQQLRLYALDFPAGQGFLQEDMRIPMAGSASGKVFQTGKPLALSGLAWLDSEIYPVGAVEGVQSGGCLPLISRHRVLGVWQLTRLQAQAFTQDDVEFLSPVASPVALAVENALE